MARSPRPSDPDGRSDASDTGDRGDAGAFSARFLTRSGLGAAIAALGLAVLGWWWRYEELVVVAAGIAAALAVAMWSARVAHAAQIVRRITTLRVARGEPVRVRYRINNVGRRRSTTATIVDECDGETSRVEIPSVAAKDRAEVRASIATRRRGVHQVGPWFLERHDAFGLAVGRRTSGDVGTVIVHPRVHPLSGPYGAMHIVENEAVIRRVASDPLSGFVSLREYVQGDDPRLIHWPTTARMGTLMLREHVELRRPEFTVVLDTAAESAPPDDFEEMVDVAASVAVHAIRSGVDVTVRTTSREHPGSRRSVSAESTVLDLLTPVGQSPAAGAASLAEMFRDGIDHTAIVMVTGPNGPTSGLARTSTMSVVRVGRGSVIGPGVALAVDDAQQFAQRWRPWH